MDDLEVARFWRMGTPGTLSPWCRWLIGTTTIATIVVAYLSWHLVWDLYGCDWQFYGFWVRNGIWLGIAVACVATLIPPSRVSRFIRLATLLPAFHLIALVASLVLWMAIQHHAEEWGRLGDVLMMPIDTSTGFGIAVVLLAGSAWLIQPREWLQSMLVLALSFLFLFGAWLPYCAASWFHDAKQLLEYTLLSPRDFLEHAIAPPLVGALGFTTLVMRWPAFAKNKRAWTIAVVSLLLIVAMLSQIGPERDGTVLYLNAAHLVLMAQSLAIITLVAAGMSMWIAAGRARVRVREARSEQATIVDPDGDREPVVEVELVGWLRAPRVQTFPFEVSTARDRMPVGGTSVLWSVPPATTRLAIGERCAVLRRGDPVTRYSHDLESAGHPFRNARHVDVLAIAAPEAGNGFTNMTLMLWRPAVAYMAITLAIMVPAALALIAK